MPRTGWMRAAPAAAFILSALFLTPTASAAGTVNTWTCSTGDTASGCSASTIAPITTARAYLGAASLSSAGDIYAIDGATAQGSYSNKNEGYSPSGNSWSTMKKDAYTRAGTTVVADQSDGWVYAVGGGGSTWTNDANYYTPSTNAWTTLPSFPLSLGYAGGAVGSDGMLYIMGGQTSSGYVANVEAYSPSASAWYCSANLSGCTSTSTPPIAMPTARASLAVVEDANGLIYAMGGQTGASSYTSVVEAYNPGTQTWTCSTGDTGSGCSSTTLAPMPTARAVAAATTSNGLIYLIGGNNAGNLGVVEVYNPTTNTWACSTGDIASGCSSTVLTPLPTPRAGAGVALGSDGQIYVVGGLSGSTYLSTVEAYDPPTTPGSPTSVSAVAGSGTATVSWTAPSGNGGMPISGYTVTCSPSCTPVNVGANASTAVVNGLTNGSAYTFSVVATNFVGSGAAGTSGSVTPATCTSGTPTVSGAAPGAFPSLTLSGADQVTYSSLSTYTASDGACGGWNITFQASRLTCSAGTGSCPGGGDSLPSGSLLIAPPTVSCNSGTSCAGVTGPPSISISGNTAIDAGAAVKVASASTNTGEGSYTLTPGSVAGSGTQISLSVPSYAYASTYNSTVTVSIVSGP